MLAIGGLIGKETTGHAKKTAFGKGKEGSEKKDSHLREGGRIQPDGNEDCGTLIASRKSANKTCVGESV